MAEKVKQLSRLHGLGRWAARLPIWLYRVHLGWLLGSRFLYLTHTGRKSGLPRHTVIEVVRYDRANRTFYVASGWGEKSDWYRNVMAHPRVTVQSGRIRQVAIAHRLEPQQAGDELVRYAHEHPMAWKELASFMGYRLDGTDADIQEVGQTLPILAFRPVAPDKD